MNGSPSRPYSLRVELDRFDRLLDRMSNPAAEGYPPFNVEQVSANALRVELAVAGFAPEELSVDIEELDLVVRGRRASPPEGNFLHRGIATRQFKRIFRLPDGFEVAKASLDKGILAIDLRRPLETAAARKIEIRADASEKTGRGQSRVRGE
jgi:HSP20 family molecular chaperone IbpA